MPELDKNNNLEVDNPTASDKGANDKDDKGTQETEDPKSFTQEQVDEIVSKRINKESSKFEKKLLEMQTKMQEDAERYSKMSEDEKKKEQDERKRKEDEDRDRNLTLRENKLEAREKLSELSMPSVFVDIVLNVDLDAQNDNIEKIHKAWTTAIAEEVKKQTKGEAPKDPSSTEGDDKDADEAGSFFM